MHGVGHCFICPLYVRRIPERNLSVPQKGDTTLEAFKANGGAIRKLTRECKACLAGHGLIKASLPPPA